MEFKTLKRANIHYHWINGNHQKNIVFINSLGSSFIIWNDVVSILKNEFNILLFDKPGHGLSSSIDGEVFIEDYANIIVELMGHLKIDKINSVGLSIGGLVNYAFLKNHPKRIEKAVFCCTGAKIGTDEFWNERLAFLKSNGVKSSISANIERWLTTEFIKNQKDRTQGYLTMLERIDEKGYIQACEAIMKANYLDFAPKVQHPTLFIAGTKDIVTPPQFVEENAKLTKSKLQIIENVGHLPCAEKPNELASIISTFIKKESN